MAKVVIEVEGGVVTNVYTDSGDVDEYVIVDRDVQDTPDAEDFGYISIMAIDKPPSLTGSHIPSEIVAEIKRAS